MRGSLLFASLWTAWVAIAAPFTAKAGNLESFFQSDEAAMTAGAVAAMTNTTGAIWYNPAGLGHNDRNRINLSASAFTLRLREIPGGMQTVFGDELIEEDLSTFDVLVVPSALSFAWQLKPGLSVGLGVFISEQDFFTINGGESTTRSDGAEVSPLGQITSETVRYHIGPSVGWQATPRLRIGASAFLVYQNRTTIGEFLLESRSADGDGFSAFAQFESARVDIAAEAVLGVQWEPIDRLHIGFVVRTPRFAIADFQSGDERISRGDADSEPIIFDLGDSNAGASHHMLSGPRFVAAVGASFDRGEVSVEFDYTPTFDGLNRQSVWNVRAGGIAHLSQVLHMGAGFFTDRSSALLTSFPESQVDYYGLAFGVDIRKPVRLAQSEDADDIIFSTTIGLRYAVGIGDATRVQFQLAEAGVEPALRIQNFDPTGVVFHEVSLHIGSAVEF